MPISGYSGIPPSGIKPDKPAPTSEPSLDFFSMNAVSDPMPRTIKSESDVGSACSVVRGHRIRTHVHAVIDRNTVMGRMVPAGEMAMQRDNVVHIDTPSIIDVDHYTQKSAYYTNLNDELIKAAFNTPHKYLFGLCNLTRCGRYWGEAAHAIVFYATDCKVVYIDCQLSPDSVIENLTDWFIFMGQEKSKGVTVQTFGNLVFYAPVMPHRVELMNSFNSKAQSSKSLAPEIRVPEFSINKPFSTAFFQPLVPHTSVELNNESTNIKNLF